MHVLQGLNVVIFATVKQCLSEEGDDWEQRTGKKISKTNFLEIYGRAHLHALTLDNIKASFRQTGVWPLDPSVVTKEMMAPSKESSCEGHLPVVPTTPIQVITKLLQKLSLDKGLAEDGDGNSSSNSNDISDDDDADNGGEDEADGKDEADGEGKGDGDGQDGDGQGNSMGGSDAQNSEGDGSSGPSDLIDAIKEAIKSLSQGTLAELVSSEPMTSTTELRHNTAHAISLAKPHANTLKITPKT
jgi:hypothetical protein